MSSQYHFACSLQQTLCTFPRKAKRKRQKFKNAFSTFCFGCCSLKQLKSPHLEDLSSTISDHYSLDLAYTAENAKTLNCSMSLPSSENSEEKMFADSAFQSLGDGLELEQDEKSSPPPSPKLPTKLEPTKLELQMKSIAEEAKNLRLSKGGFYFCCDFGGF